MNTLDFAIPPRRDASRERVVRQAILDRRRSPPAVAPEGAIERLTAAVQQLLGVRSTARAPLTIAQAARTLGVSRSRTLLPAIAANLVTTVAWGRRRRITLEEIERLQLQGFGGKKRLTRRTNRGAADANTARLTYAQARSKP